MGTMIRYARPEDEEQLRDLLVSHGMDLAGAIHDHVVVQQGDQIIAGGMISPVDDALYHLEVLAVGDKWRRTGAGRMLLSALIDAPWQYSSHDGSPEESYSITTVARGDAVPFYAGCGFESYSFDELAAPYDEQCQQCPDRESCQPVPMIFRRGIKI
ncbi:MAG TPA: GNAT family N-acetyltransferase [Syntrophomonas sp.]|nr:GNAT family N-acetyltransferase [Syntrophomonas sp.]